MLMNDKGEKVLYQYESSENTLQLYHQQKEEENDNTKTYIFMLTTALFALTTICSFIYLYFFKKKSIVAIKAYYERRANRWKNSLYNKCRVTKNHRDFSSYNKPD